MTNKTSSRGRRRTSRGKHRDTAGDGKAVPLYKRTASHFERGDRDRGTEYFEEGRVELEIDGMRARASVKGTEQDVYRVGVDWSQVGERILRGFCECRRFADGRPCKHLWATLLALDAAGPAGRPPGRDRLSLRKDRAANWGDLGVEQREQAPRRARGAPARRGRPPRRGEADGWRSRFEAVREAISKAAEPRRRPTPDVLLLINTAASDESLVLDVFSGAGGQGGRPKPASIEPDELEELLLPPDGEEEPVGEIDLAVIPTLVPEPASRKGGRRPKGRAPRSGVRRFQIPADLYDIVLPHLCDEGTLSWWDGRSPGNPPPISWDAGRPWKLALRLERVAGGSARLTGVFERAGESVSVADPALILPGGRDGADPASGLLLVAKTLAPLDATRERDLPWLEMLAENGEIRIPNGELDEALVSLLELPELPELEAPDDMDLEQEPAEPQPRLVLEPLPVSGWNSAPLLARLSFLYGALEVNAEDLRPAIVDWEEGRYARRDIDKERESVVRLVELGLRPIEGSQDHGLQLRPGDLPDVAEALLSEGWSVEVHGVSLRRPSPPALKVESGIDWFELSGGVEFAGDRVAMRELLSAISKGERFIELGDGSKGVLPESWMETYGSLSELAQEETEEGLRFLTSQAALVDALLTAMPPVQADAAFTELREKLASFERVEPKKEARGFKGTLRGYQRQGLGWLSFLRDFGLGGALADDMGLGKTVQVLAHLHAYRAPSKTSGLPSLVVAPRSLVYNWVDEAQRFTPKLKVVEYHGSDREQLQGKLGDYDMVVTTYGTLRRDVGYLSSVEFDTVVLDEAQAIKNPESQTAKASRLLNGRYRLALTGTPIENHLGELGSIFEFLNPGLLGRMPRLEVLVSGGAPSREQLALVAKGMRPFILRRKKGDVLADLPPKTEQVLFCSLRPEQRELYDGLRAQYQANLLDQVATKGVAGSTMQVLEALLRLRQVACHPGLVREGWERAGSAKLEALFEQVDEVLEEGHKAIVFSQFTSLLAYVREHLEQTGVPYAYLDGQTRDRSAPVERFQNDPDCQLFLISLKAGGTGLNLTAAGYVFLLDPWWNPAVEAQAIDRAHRIGQTQPVFAYRMIARDTVEEKILDLQRSKKQLAESILEGGEAGIGELTADDLKMLLS